MEVDQLFQPAIRNWNISVTVHDNGYLAVAEVTLLRDGKTAVTFQMDPPAPIEELGALIQSAVDVR